VHNRIAQYTEESRWIGANLYVGESDQYFGGLAASSAVTAGKTVIWSGNPTHGLFCRKSAGRDVYVLYVDAVNNLIRRALIGVSIPAMLEPPLMSRNDDKRSDVLTILPWVQGRCLHLSDSSTERHSHVVAASSHVTQCRLWSGNDGSPSNTKSPWPRPISVPSGILIHPAVCP